MMKGVCGGVFAVFVRISNSRRSVHVPNAGVVWTNAKPGAFGWPERNVLQRISVAQFLDNVGGHAVIKFN